MADDQTMGQLQMAELLNVQKEIRDLMEAEAIARDSRRSLSVFDIFSATFMGALLAIVIAYLALLLLAQVAPNDFYLPIKFVVDPDEVPDF